MNKIPTVGDVLDCAIWLSGTETVWHIEKWKTDVREFLCPPHPDYDITLTQPEFKIKNPGDERVPPVPANVSGPNVRLLVAEARVTAVKRVVLDHKSFLADLDKVDLERLRRITRRTYTRLNGDKSIPLTDEECDQVIEANGPAAAAKSVMEAVNSRAVH